MRKTTGEKPFNYEPENEPWTNTIRFDSIFRLEVSELKTSNIHRLLIHLYGDGRNFTEHDFQTLREEIIVNVKKSSLKGLGFGLVLHEFECDPLLQYDAVDDWANSKGVCQWIIVLDEAQKSANGIHMWLSGRMTPVFEEIIAKCHEEGWTTTNKYKQLPSLQRWFRVLQNPLLLLTQKNRPWLPASRFQPPYDHDVF